MNIANNWEWSSHQPLIRAVLAEFKPRYILELGMGEYSTPIFIDYSPEFMLSVENDVKWQMHIKKKYGTKYKSVLHQLESNLGSKSFVKDMTDTQKESIKNYYIDLGKSIEETDIHPKLLFVDQFTCCRTISINTLYPYFDIIIYHDCEPRGVVWYEYYFEEKLKTDFLHYTLKTPAVWTGCFLKNSLKDNNLNKTISPYIEKYCEENKLNKTTVKLVNE